MRAKIDAIAPADQPALEVARRLARVVSARAGDAFAHHDAHARLVGGLHLDDAQLERVAERDELVERGQPQRAANLFARGARGRDRLRA